MAKTTVRVGFVGIGRMGANMARRLKDAGYSIAAVYDIEPTRVDRLAKELECHAVKNPAHVAERAETVFTVVTDDEAMRGIYSREGTDSLLAHAKGRLFINCATLSPHIHVEIEALVERYGGQTLEACIASSIPQARQGTLYLMCGGKKAAFERAKPLLESLSASLRYIGEAGQARWSKPWSMSS